MGYWATSPCYRFNPLAKVQAQEVEKVLKACRNPHRMHQRSTRASSFSSESLLQSAFDLRGSNPPPNEHRLDMELTLNVLEWIPLSVNLCWCYLMFIFLCSLTREAQVAYLIPFRRGAFSKTSSAAPATNLPLNFTFTELPFKTLQYSSIYFIMFQCWTLICFNLVGVWRCNISPRIMDFEHILGHEATACMNDVAWCYHFGSISMETLFGRDQGQSDLSGVEAGHWSVRRWRGKRSNIHINASSPLVTISSSTSHFKCQLFMSKYGKKMEQASLLCNFEDHVEQTVQLISPPLANMILDFGVLRCSFCSSLWFCLHHVFLISLSRTCIHTLLWVNGGQTATFVP